MRYGVILSLKPHQGYTIWVSFQVPSPSPSPSALPSLTITRTAEATSMVDSPAQGAARVSISFIITPRL